MNLELVVDARSNGVWIALLRDGKLIELHEDRGNTDFSVGDVYLGRVRRVANGLNAAFVDVGYEKDAFALSRPRPSIRIVFKIRKGQHQRKTKRCRPSIL